MKNPKARTAPRRAARATTKEFPAELAWLACAAPACPAPPSKVRRTLLARIAAEEKAAARPAPRGWRFDSVNVRRGWLTMPFPGVRMKELSVDRTRDSALVLVEMERGARFPDHEHEFSDEGFVLSGDVTSGGRLLHAGDYYHAGPGSTHSDIVSPGGCTALVRLTAGVWHDLRAQALPVA